MIAEPRLRSCPTTRSCTSASRCAGSARRSVRGYARECFEQGNAADGAVGGAGREGLRGRQHSGRVGRRRDSGCPRSRSWRRRPRPPVSWLLMLVVSPAIAGSILTLHGTDEQKDRWLRGIAAGTTRIAFAITEPDAGTNSHNLRTELRRTDDGLPAVGSEGLHLRGRGRRPRCWSLPACATRTVSSASRACASSTSMPRALRASVIPMPYIGPDRQWTLFFDGVEVSADRLVGGEHGGLAAVFDGLNPERIMIAAQAQRLWPAGAREGQPRTRTSASSGGRRSAPIRALHIRWRRRRSSSSWRG